MLIWRLPHLSSAMLKLALTQHAWNTCQACEFSASAPEESYGQFLVQRKLRKFQTFSGHHVLTSEICLGWQMAHCSCRQVRNVGALEVQKVTNHQGKKSLTGEALASVWLCRLCECVCVCVGGGVLFSDTSAYRHFFKSDKTEKSTWVAPVWGKISSRSLS